MLLAAGCDERLDPLGAQRLDIRLGPVPGVGEDGARLAPQGRGDRGHRRHEFIDVRHGSGHVLGHEICAGPPSTAACAL